MRAQVLWLCGACACTQNFGTFDPADGAAPDTGADASVTDAAPEGAPPDGGLDASDAAPGPDATAKDAAPDVGPADAGADAAVPCTETGAIQYGGHCYFPVASAQDFATAKTYCANAGAHLVTITTSGEQAAVAPLGSGERWIGLYRSTGAAKDQFYAWITGESRNGYGDWSPGEPNGTGQCGTLLGTGLWNDEDCTISLASICERE